MDAERTEQDIGDLLPEPEATLDIDCVLHLVSSTVSVVTEDPNVTVLVKG